ncbi:MAG: hypothetical protein ABIO58_04060 [Luteimonas sp.]
MNIFKGLLFLQGYVNAADFVDAHERPHYGAATVARKLAPPLGNRAASRDWFGSDGGKPVDPGIDAGCVVGGCG